MKIFLFKKKKLVITLAIILVTIISLFLFYLLQSNRYLAIELACNAEVSNGFLENGKNLTKGEEKIAYLTFDDGPTISVTP